MSSKGGWVAFAMAAMLHVWMLAALIHRAEDVRHGRAGPVPAPFGIFHDATWRIGPGADFFALYHAGISLERDQGIYGITPDPWTPYYYVYRYLPGLAQTGGRLLAGLLPWAAFYVWLAFLELLVLANLWLAATLLRDQRTLVPWCGALALAFTPLWLELWMGQFTLLMGTLLLACGAALRSGRTGLAQLAWIAGVGVKIVPAVLLALWWRMGLLLRATLLFAALAALNVPSFLAHNHWSSFVAANFGTVAEGTHDAGNHGLAYLSWMLLVRALGVATESWPAIYTVLQLAWLGIACAVVAVQRKVEPLPSLVVLILAHQLSYMHVWEHHYVLALPMGLLLLAHAPRRRAAVLASLVALALPTPFALLGPPEGWSLAAAALPAAAKVLPTLILFTVAVAACLEPRPAVQPATT